MDIKDMKQAALRHLALASLFACSGSVEEITCPRGWEASGLECAARLPSRERDPGVGAPEALGPEDHQLDLAALAEHFQPAHVFAGAEIWPVTVDYCWPNGGEVNLYAPGDDAARAVVPVEAGPFHFGTLGLQAGEVAQIDCPGDNSGPGAEEATWFDHWRVLQGDDPRRARFPPTHYVHIAWFDRARRELLIQYWFWYPFDKFANNHEGDWEHINVIVALDPEPTLIDIHMYSHGTSLREFERLTRVGGHGDHVVIFSGGCGEFLGWTGCYSGASLPWAGVYDLLVPEDTTRPARFLHPDDISVVLLPEPEMGDLPAAISWLPYDVRFGQWIVHENHPVLSLSDEAAAVPPHPWFKGTWNTASEDPWAPEGTWVWLDLPADWEVLYNPGATDEVSPHGGQGDGSPDGG